MREQDDWHSTEFVVHEQGRGDPFAAAIRGTRMPMIITDPRLPDNPIVFANEAFQSLTGYGRGEVLGRNCRFLQGHATDPDAVAKIRTAVGGREALNVDILNYRKDGSTFWNALYISPVRSDAGEVQFFFASQLDVTDRIEAERTIRVQKEEVEAEVKLRTAALEKALEVQTTLLHEVDHRVKNNLTMIGSLLRLQSRALRDPKLAATIDNMLLRVDALAAVHRRLYQSDDITRFDLAAFANDLVRDVIGASGRENVALVAAVGPASIRADQATPIGMILNELMTNAIKHAFADGRSGKLAVEIRQEDERVTMSVADDGPGFDPGAGSTSMGLSLITRLCRQLDATLAWSDNDPGSRATISFSTGILG